MNGGRQRHHVRVGELSRSSQTGSREEDGRGGGREGGRIGLPEAVADHSYATPLYRPLEPIPLLVQDKETRSAHCIIYRRLLARSTES